MRATITGHDIATSSVNNKETQYVVYSIECVLNKHQPLESIEWTVSRRYSDFATFNTELQTVISNSTRSKLSLSKLFPKKFFFGNLKEENIVKRQEQLQLWLDVIVNNQETGKTQLFDQFLEISKHKSTFHNNLSKSRSQSVMLHQFGPTYYEQSAHQNETAEVLDSSSSETTSVE
jgi:hypothetical protein